MSQFSHELFTLCVESNNKHIQTVQQNIIHYGLQKGPASNIKKLFYLAHYSFAFKQLFLIFIVILLN